MLNYRCRIGHRFLWPVRPTTSATFFNSVVPALTAATLLAAGTLSDPAALRTKIQQTFHVPNPLPSLDVQKHGSFEPEPGIVADRVTYNTQLNMRVPAIVYHRADTSVK